MCFRPLKNSTKIVRSRACTQTFVKINTCTWPLLWSLTCTHKQKWFSVISKDEIVNQYKYVFVDLGKFPGQVEIKLKPKAEPKIFPTRSYIVKRASG